MTAGEQTLLGTARNATMKDIDDDIEDLHGGFTELKVVIAEVTARQQALSKAPQGPQLAADMSSLATLWASLRETHGKQIGTLRNIASRLQIMHGKLGGNPGADVPAALLGDSLARARKLAEDGAAVTESETAIIRDAQRLLEGLSTRATTVDDQLRTMKRDIDILTAHVCASGATVLTLQERVKSEHQRMEVTINTRLAGVRRAVEKMADVFASVDRGVSDALRDAVADLQPPPVTGSDVPGTVNDASIEADQAKAFAGAKPSQDRRT